MSRNGERAQLIDQWIARARAGEPTGELPPRKPARRTVATVVRELASVDALPPAPAPEPKKRAGRGQAPHGSRSKYAAGCRCPQCREAARIYARQRAAKLAGLDPATVDPTAPPAKGKRGRPRTTERGARVAGLCLEPGASPPHMHCICGCPMNRLAGEPRRRYCVSCVELGRAEDLPTIDDLAVLSPGASPEIKS